MDQRWKKRACKQRIKEKSTPVKCRLKVSPRSFQNGNFKSWDPDFSPKNLCFIHLTFYTKWIYPDMLWCRFVKCFRIIQLHGQGLVEWLRNAFLGWTLWMQYLLTEFSIFVALPNYSGMLCKTSPCQIHFNSRQTQPPYIYKIFNTVFGYTGWFFSHWYPPKSFKYRKVNLGLVRCI